MGRVGIFDATNTTKDRRQWIVDELLTEKHVESRSHIIFVESICTDEHIIDVRCSYTLYIETT